MDNRFQISLCLDCVGDNLGFKGNAKAVFSLAGALGFTDYIQEATDSQVVMFHSEDDDTVPYHSGQPFSSLLWLVVGSDLPDVYGSQAIAERGDEVGLNYQFNSYSIRGHSVHEETESSLYQDIIPKISDSFYVHFLTPPLHEINGDTIVCDDQINKDYHSISEAYYYDWELLGGTFIDMNIFSSSVSVSWDPVATEHILMLTPYSIHGAKGKTDSLHVNVYAGGDNTWTGQSGSWMDISKWSLGHMPQVCEDVFFNDQPLPVLVDLNTGDLQRFRSITIGKNTNIFQQLGARIKMVTGGRFELIGNYHLEDEFMIEYPINHHNKDVIIEGKFSISAEGKFLVEP
jgi:hypothetical protein